MDDVVVMDDRTRVAVAVLLEGRSDVAAVRAVATKRGVDLSHVRLVDADGVTNFARAIDEIDTATTELLGLYDRAEARFVVRALGLEQERDLAERGFFACDADLEEELIRALGPESVLTIIDELGLMPKFNGLRQQPAWHDQPLADQLHRFCGSASGRKEWLAGELATRLEELPPPLALLLERL